MFGLSLPTITDIEVVAEDILVEALASTAQQLNLEKNQDTIKCLQNPYHRAWIDFHYNLASQIAEHIGSLDGNIKAAYIDEYDITFEDHFFGETARTTEICLIIWTQPKNSFQYALIEKLDQSLASTFVNLIGNPVISHILKVMLFDDVDAKNPDSYGGWLSSVYFPLTEVWRRDGIELDY